MPRHLAIDTAYARNIADPLVLTIDGTDYQLDPAISVGHLAALFAGFQDGMDAVNDESQPVDGRVKAMEAKRVDGVNALTKCVCEAQREAFSAEARERVDVMTLANIVTWLLSEVSGQATPTQPPSSSNGSQADGPPSTAGALPEASTSSTSPPTAP